MLPATPTLFLALGAFLSFPQNTLAVGLVQKQNLVLPADAAKYREQVKTIFTDSYSAYKSVKSDSLNL